MNSTFNDLSEDSRIWIYQSNKELNNDQVSEISSELNEFLKTWNTHGKPMKKLNKSRKNPEEQGEHFRKT